MLPKTRRLLTLGLAAALLASCFSLVASAASAKRPSSRTTKQVTVRDVAARGTASKHRSGKRSRHVRRARGQRAPEPARIQEIQQALIDRGYLQPSATGKWDGASSEAMRRFQRENGLDETGKFDARSLIKLGLGPPTAGVAAPRELASTPDSSGNGKR